MPRSPRRACGRPGCGRLRPCPVHGARPLEPTSTERRKAAPRLRLYDTAAWRKASKAFRAGKTCERCIEQRRVRLAEVTDHRIPHDGDEGLFWDRENWRALCWSCHNAVRPEQFNGRTASVARAVPATLVIGPPCGGKTTYVAEHREPGDLVVDLDALYVALGADMHGQTPALRPYATAARDAVLSLLWAGRHRVGHAWVIKSAPKAYQRQDFVARGCRIVLCTAPLSVLLRRADRDRPDGWADHIRAWQESYESAGVDAVVDTQGEA